MKHDRILTAALAALLIILAVSGAAFAADIRPIPVDHDRVDLENGTFNLTVRMADRIEKNSFFVAALYLEDRYDGNQIRSLAPGDTVTADDRIWTVKEVVVHSSDETPEDPAAYEIYPEEELDGYLAFQPCADGAYAAVINDWIPVTPAGSTVVRLPLPDTFEYIRISAGEEEAPVNADEFIRDLGTFSPDAFVAYNTTCEFRDGQLVKVISSSYPGGPEETEGAEAMPVPVWKFCHGLRDGLDTAEITGFMTDCEEGPLPAEITPEEAEWIRSLAIHGKVTGKASDESLTGGTYLYTFRTPGGKHLLTIEMYKGLIAGDDGMYRFEQ